MSICVNFFYKDLSKDRHYEVLVTSFANLISEIIELPDTIEVLLYPLEPNVHGGIDINRVNRIVMNTNLSYEEIPMILTHELIHVSQKHNGLLTMDRQGMCYWRGIPYTNKKPEDMTYEEYENLPWEVDVRHRQTKVLTQALQLYNKA